MTATILKWCASGLCGCDVLLITSHVTLRLSGVRPSRSLMVARRDFLIYIGDDRDVVLLCPVPRKRHRAELVIVDPAFRVAQIILLRPVVVHGHSAG